MMLTDYPWYVMRAGRRALAYLGWRFYLPGTDVVGAWAYLTLIGLLVTIAAAWCGWTRCRTPAREDLVAVTAHVLRLEDGLGNSVRVTLAAPRLTFRYGLGPWADLGVRPRLRVGERVTVHVRRNTSSRDVGTDIWGLWARGQWLVTYDARATANPLDRVVWAAIVVALLVATAGMGIATWRHFTRYLAEKRRERAIAGLRYLTATEGPRGPAKRDLTLWRTPDE